MAPLADYLTVNISSPNTPGLRALQDKGALEALLDGVAAAQPRAQPLPVFLESRARPRARRHRRYRRGGAGQGLAAVIVSNTTIVRGALASRHAQEAGGLSGRRSPDWRSSG